MKKIVSSFAFFLGIAAFAASAGAYAPPAYQGMARPWELGLQPAATPVMARLEQMHGMLLVIITIITLLVLAALAYICIRFRRKANPVPSKVTHNTVLEIVWTAIPILILVIIAIPSLRLHYYMQRIVNPELTVKVTGYQWYWHYDYPDQGGFGFDSTFKKGNELKAGEVRQLAVDNHLVVPVNTKVRVLVTGADVIHSWAVPAFGVKKDAVPGRLNETWFEADKIGTFYGQCSQLCGVGHGFMPIVIDVVSKEDFAGWVKQKQKEGGIAPPANSPEAKQEHLRVAPVTGAAKATGPTPEKVAPAKNAPAAELEVPLAKPQVNSPRAKPQTSTDKSTEKAPQAPELPSSAPSDGQ